MIRVTTCENYGVYSHQQIRHEMYDGAGPSSQGEAMVGWHELAGRLTAIRHYLDAAISGVQASRQGAAADAAVGSMVPLGTWVDEAQRLANDTRERIDHQISGFTMTRNSIPEVPLEPRGSGWQDFAVIDTFTTSDQEADEAFNAEQQRQARAAMMAYQTGTNERVGSVAQFAPPPTGTPDLTVPTGNHPGVGALPGGGGSGLGAMPGATTSPSGVGGGTPGDLSGAPPAPTGSQGGGGTGSADHPVGRPAPAAPAPPGGGGVPGGVVPGTAPVGAPTGTGPGPVSAGRGGLGNAGGVRGGSAAGGFGPWGRGVTGVGGFGAERGAGPAGSPDSPAARGPGVAGAGRAGGAGTAGGTAPFAGVGRNRGGEDNERQRPSYLLELDSNRLIGELPRTSPAVIGDDPPDDDEPRRR